MSEATDSSQAIDVALVHLRIAQDEIRAVRKETPESRAAADAMRSARDMLLALKAQG